MIASERLVLDTSAYSHFRAGHPAVLDHIAEAPIVVIPVVVLGELEAAFSLGTRSQENRQSVADFLSEPFVSLYDVTKSTARCYGRIFAALRRAGTPIPLNEVWIAASTTECGGHLLTFDTDFSHVPDLEYTLLSPTPPF